MLCEVRTLVSTGWEKQTQFHILIDSFVRFGSRSALSVVREGPVMSGNLNPNA